MTQLHYHLSLLVSTLLFVAMIVFNALANTLPINGQSTGDVSYKFPNLFQPAGLTFAIWGVIYLLLGVFIVNQLFKWQLDVASFDYPIVKILILFSISCLLNIAWLFLWHYEKMLFSSIVIIMLLATLLYALQLAYSSPVILKSSLSIYAGWISIATIANITILFVKLGVSSFSTRAVIFTLVLLVIGAFLGIFYIFIKKDFIYGAVFVWAYLGIFLRHLKQENLPQTFPIITITSLVLTLCIMAVSFFTFINQMK